MMRIQGRLNGVAGRWRLVNAAVGDHTGSQDMVTTGVHGAGYFLAPGPDHSASELTKTQVTTVDDLADRFSFSPSHLKIDVEGYEGEVLLGARRVLAGPAAPLVFLELHNQLCKDRHGNPERPLALLEHLGYRPFSLAGDPMSRTALLGRPLLRVVYKQERV